MENGKKVSAHMRGAARSEFSGKASRRFLDFMQYRAPVPPSRRNERLRNPVNPKALNVNTKYSIIKCVASKSNLIKRNAQ